MPDAHSEKIAFEEENRKLWEALLEIQKEMAYPRAAGISAVKSIVDTLIDSARKDMEHRAIPELDS